MSSLSLRSRRLAFSAVAALAAGIVSLSVSCGGGGGSPSGSTPPVTIAPQPTPTPTPSFAASCPLGAGDLNAECSKTSSKLQGALLGTMDLLVQQQPQLFDKTNQSGVGTGQYRVVDKEGYLNGLVANLIAAGYCAERDPDDGAYERIRVKNENGFSENFDVLTSSGHMRRGSNNYFETCTPANFPVDRSGLPAPGSGCGYPYPPPLFKMGCKVHLLISDVYTLDSTALVGDLGYCAQVGFTDGRSICPVRPEDSPERGPCEAWRVGNAKDTGRPGPTWTVGGQYCTGPASGCENHPTNQHQLLVYRSGSYKVCANSGTCCTLVVE